MGSSVGSSVGSAISSRPLVQPRCLASVLAGLGPPAGPPGLARHLPYLSKWRRRSLLLGLGLACAKGGGQGAALQRGPSSPAARQAGHLPDPLPALTCMIPVICAVDVTIISN